jgi:hypothetical protein
MADGTEQVGRVMPVIAYHRRARTNGAQIYSRLPFSPTLASSLHEASAVKGCIAVSPPHEHKWIYDMLGPGLCCIAPAAASPCMRSGPTRAHTIMPNARGVVPVRRETRRHEATNDEDGRALHIFAGDDTGCGNAVIMLCDRRLLPNY